MELLALPAVVLAGGFTYSINADNTITIRGHTDPVGELIIPENIVGRTVNSIGHEAFINTSLTGVTISDSVTNIEDWAFAFCQCLTNMTIGNSVAKIGNRAFYYNNVLASAMIPDSVENIGLEAFYACPSLTSLTIGQGVTNIGEAAFHSCTSLTSITVNTNNSIYCSPNGVLFNKSQTMLIQYPGSKPGSYTVPESVTNIEDLAFSFCAGLTSISLPISVEYIGVRAFFSCDSLTCVAIPKNVTHIGERAFYACDGLIAITVDTSNSVYSSSNGVLLNKNQTTLIQCPGGKIGGYTIPNSVTNIGDEAFVSCDRLTGMVIPDSVISIGTRAYLSCTSLTNVAIGNSVTHIGDSAFYSCYSLVNAVIPASVTIIGDQAFYGCTNLTRLYFHGYAPHVDGGPFAPFLNTTIYYLPGAEGWPPVPELWAGRPTALWLPEAQAGGMGVQEDQFGFNINWAAGMTVVVEACTSLIDPDWIPVGTNMLTNGTAYFGDSEWTNRVGRFYRLREP